MPDIGLLPIAQKIAAIAHEVARAKKGAAEARKRIAAEIMPLLEEVVEIGIDQAIISASERKAARRQGSGGA